MIKMRPQINEIDVYEYPKRAVGGRNDECSCMYQLQIPRVAIKLIYTHTDAPEKCVHWVGAIYPNELRCFLLNIPSSMCML
jgi:hypothetical protein